MESLTQLSTNISIGFRSSDFIMEQVVVSHPTPPVSVSRCLFQGRNLSKGSHFSMWLSSNGEQISAQEGTLPTDWSNPFDAAATIWGAIDKSVLANIPLIGVALEKLAPDAKWTFDLWFEIVINEDGRMLYKVHFGPSIAPGVRNKLEGEFAL